MVWLHDGEKYLLIYLSVLTEFTNLPDGHTDRHTQRERQTRHAALA